MCLKINWPVKRHDIGQVWKLPAQGYGLLERVGISLAEVR